MWNLIPQLFYDFLARVIPGVTLIVVTIIIIVNPITMANFLLNSPMSDRLFSTGTLIMLLLGSYLVGFLLSHLWEMTIGQLTKLTNNKNEVKCQQECIEEHNKMQKILGRSVLNIIPDNLPRISVMRDHLRHIVPEEAARLLKLRAEQRSCQVLLLGFLILSIVNGVYLALQVETVRLVFEVFLVLAVIICWNGAKRIQMHLMNGTIVSWLVLILSSKLSTQNKE